MVVWMACLGCSAQATESNQTEVSRSLERKMRAIFALPPQAKIIVGPLQPSETPGYDALTVTFDDPGNKREVEFLLAKDRKTLLRIFHIDMNRNPYSEVMKNIDTTGRPTRGAKDAKVVAVTYDDFQCPFCARMHSTLFPTLLKEYGDRVLFVYKDFPLEDIHPWAKHAAANANCLAAQNVDAYWDFADYMHANQKDINNLKAPGAPNAALDKLTLERGVKFGLDAAKLQACITAQDDKAIRASQAEGQKLGVTATPETFVNGQKVDGALPIEDIRAALDSALRDAGVAPPAH